MYCVLTMVPWLVLTATQPAWIGKPAQHREPDLAILTRELSKSPPESLPEARKVFAAWLEASPENASLQGFSKRLAALEALREETGRQLRAAGSKAVGALMKEVLDQGGTTKATDSRPQAAVIPPEQLYRLFLPYFRYAIDVTQLSAENRDFLSAYYNAEAHAAIQEIMRSGGSLAMAGEREARELKYYLVLLPLLHGHGQFSMESLAGMPAWIMAPQHLEDLRDFCIFRVGRLDAAEAIWLRLADKSPDIESRYAFYMETANRCVAARTPDTAVECLRTCIRLLDREDSRVVQLRLRICEVWAGAGNWALAAGEAGQIARDFGSAPEGGQALVLRMRYLATQGDNHALLREVDEVIADSRCAQHLPELQYHKWKVLRRTGQGPPASSVLKAFLAKYPHDARAAEMYYSIAVDCLSAQRYDDALTILEVLQERHPDSSFAKKAADLISKLRTINPAKNLKRE